MSGRITKISTKVWRKVMVSFDKKLSLACLRRDAFLNRLLETELPELDDEIPLANSVDAQQFVIEHLNSLDWKPVSLALRSDLVEKLNDICARKRIVRDAFFNRLFFLLSVPPKVIDLLFFNDDANWRTEVWIEYRNDGPAFNNTFYPLEPEINPFWAIREGLALEDREEHFYAITFDDKNFKDADLYGLNCYLPDDRIPDHPAYLKPKSLDDLLSELVQ